MEEEVTSRNVDVNIVALKSFKALHVMPESRARPTTEKFQKQSENPAALARRRTVVRCVLSCATTIL